MRIFKEVHKTLKSKNLEILLSNQGAIVKSIKFNDTFITNPPKSLKTESGEKGALFCAPIIFGRLINRTVYFRNNKYVMTYPADIDEEVIDPNKLYIHGAHHYYTYNLYQESENSISYILEKKRLHDSYPFKHTCLISYSIENDSDFIVSVEVKDSEVEIPASLTIHPFFTYSIKNHTNCNLDTIEFKANLSHIYQCDLNSTLPLPNTPPIKLNEDGPYTDWSKLETNIDHSFISKSSISEIRWGKIYIKMIDESELYKINSANINNYYPIHVWTTAGDTRNACGFEHGGPANIFELINNKHIPEFYLPIVKPTESKIRQVRYQFSLKE